MRRFLGFVVLVCVLFLCVTTIAPTQDRVEERRAGAEAPNHTTVCAGAAFVILILYQGSLGFILLEKGKAKPDLELLPFPAWLLIFCLLSMNSSNADTTSPGPWLATFMIVANILAALGLFVDGMVWSRRER